jgi:hypothetical protein
MATSGNDARKARLAEALRRNLRRRKAAAQAVDETAATADDADRRD